MIRISSNLSDRESHNGLDAARPAKLQQPENTPILKSAVQLSTAQFHHDPAYIVKSRIAHASMCLWRPKILQSINKKNCEVHDYKTRSARTNNG